MTQVSDLVDCCFLFLEAPRKESDSATDANLNADRGISSGAIEAMEGRRKPLLAICRNDLGFGKLTFRLQFLNEPIRYLEFQGPDTVVIR